MRSDRPFRTEAVLPAVFLAAAVLSVYAKVAEFPFLHFDDAQYVTENRVVAAGLTWEGAAWAFTAFHHGNWHPLTWISHMLDVEIFGLDAGWHHGINVILHAASTIFLFLGLRSMTGCTLRSGFVAALFGLHPLHVESVAWVAERKDVLSGLCWNLALLFYAGYVRKGGYFRYAAVAIAFAMGLLSKASVVTFPFVLLLLDFWPLARQERLPRLVVEKIPLFILAAGASCLAYGAQVTGGAVLPAGLYPVGIRISNALVSYVSYLGKAVLPVSLSVVYPHPWVTGKTLPAWEVAGSAAILALVTAIAARKFRGHPWLATGWLWYLGTLVPMLGLVQVGDQSMADRYTYLPLTGIFMAVSWGVPDSLSTLHRVRKMLPAAACVVLAAFAGSTWTQLDHWRSSAALFRQATENVRDNWLGHFNLGLALQDRGRHGEAALHYQETVRIYPIHYGAHVNLGIVLLRLGDVPGAKYHLLTALRLRPGDPLASNYLKAVSPAGAGGRP